MRLLILDENSQAELKRIKKFAEANEYSMDDLLDIHNGAKLVTGDNYNHTCFIPMGFKIVLSIENQNAGKFRNLSMSVDAPEKVPSIPAVEMVMQELGFRNQLMDCLIDVDTSNINHPYIQIIEQIL